MVSINKVEVNSSYSQLSVQETGRKEVKSRGLYPSNMKLTSIEKVGLAIKITSLMRYVSHAICSGIRSLKTYRPLEPVKIFLLATIPMSIHNIATNVMGVKGSTTNEKVDVGLNIVSEVGSIGDVIGVSMDGLVSVGLVAAKVAVWATPLFLVGMGLELGGLVLTTKNLVEIHKFSKTFKESANLKSKVENYALEHFSQGVALINEQSQKERSFVSKHFGIGSEKLIGMLQDIEGKAKEVFASDDEGRKAKYLHKMKSTLEFLDKRMTTLKWSKAFTIMVTTISFVAVGVLLFTPAAPLGFALLGLGAALGITHYFKMKVLTKEFENELEFAAT